MQNRYVGDIGDFGKYGLLRHMTGMGETSPLDDPLRLGVVWYLFPGEPPEEPGKGDGKFIDYLCHPTAKERKLIECDPFLYDKLHKIVIDENDRRVVRVQESGILPSDTAYHDHSLSYEPRESGDTRKLRRAEWLNSALAATAKADVVFLDPDNGITETIKPLHKNGPKYVVRPWHKNGPKYVFMDDLRRFFKEREQSLVIYHHVENVSARWNTADNQISYFAERLKESLSLPCLPWALWYHRGTARVYFIVAHERHRAVLEKRLNSFKDSPWYKQGHFELVT